jgi:hypothetical protein
VINFSIDGGALNQNLTKTNATFNLTSSNFEFKATRATHVLRITDQFTEASTCGVLFDDLMIELVLPINFLGFDVGQCDLDVCVEWQVSSSFKNAKYEVQRSLNATTWETIYKVEASEKSDVVHTYNSRDMTAGTGVYYYRVKAYDERKTYSTEIKSIRANIEVDDMVKIYPNPSPRYVFVSHSPQTFPIVVLDYQGIPVMIPIEYGEERSVIDFKSLKDGLYFLLIDQICHKVVKAE